MGNNQKLAISNIAWQPHEESDIFLLMQELGFSGLEIAPTKIFPDPLTTPKSKLQTYRKTCNKKHINIVAMQSLLFGKPELTIFDSSEQRKKTLLYLTEILNLGSELGATVAVFGSPKNRIIPKTMSQKEANEIAGEFFSKMGDAAKTCGMYFCIEANPVFYGTNFINTSEEAITLVKAVNHPHFRFHLDMGTVILNDENPSEIIEAGAPYLQHVHISDKGLVDITSDLTKEKAEQHKNASASLQKIGYNGWISIEMRALESQTESNLDNIKRALQFVKTTYDRKSRI